MTKAEQQKLINKLSHIGYHAAAEDKNSVFSAIAATYSLPSEKLEILEQHANEVDKKEINWDKNLINNLIF